MTRDERIAKIRGGRWIRYARAEEITARLDFHEKAGACQAPRSRGR